MVQELGANVNAIRKRGAGQAMVELTVCNQGFRFAPTTIWTVHCADDVATFDTWSLAAKLVLLGRIHIDCK